VFCALSCASSGQQSSEKVYTVAGFGGHPVSVDLTSIWLAAPGGQPLIMVFFHGPEGWHKTKWKVSSKFEKGMPGWVELTSEKATLRVSLDAVSGQAQVQSDKVVLSEANTYLVLNVLDAKRQRVVPLGILNLPASTTDPASVVLLNGNPELGTRIEKLIAGTAGG
jgi:hypothetical protein